MRGGGFCRRCWTGYPSRAGFAPTGSARVGEGGAGPSQIDTPLSPAHLRGVTFTSERSIRRIILALFFLSGACGLVYEVVWMRMLTLVFGATAFATAAILSTFFAGLALGSFHFGKTG